MGEPGEKHEKIELDRVPKDANGNSLIDLYIYLPTSEHFVRFIAKDTPLDKNRLGLLQTHVINDLFHLPSELKLLSTQETKKDDALQNLESNQSLQDASDSPAPNSEGDQDPPSSITSEAAETESLSSLHTRDSTSTSQDSQEVVTPIETLLIPGETNIEKGEIRSILVDTSLDEMSVVPLDGMDPTYIGVHTQVRLDKFHVTLIKGSEHSPEETLRIIENQTNQMLKALVPAEKDIKPILLNALQNLLLMNDVSAITLLAIISALAQGYDSLKSFRDLACACLLMDASLAEYPKELIEKYYKDPASLSPEELEKFKEHPQKSFEIAGSKVKGLSDVSLQLILHHHEYFNGKGYPRGIRTESLFPMVKVLSLAVCTFEEIKRSQLNKIDNTFNEIVISMLEQSVEPHLRRHNRKIVMELLKYLNIDEKNPNQNIFKLKPLEAAS